MLNKTAGMKEVTDKHPELSEIFNRDEARVDWHDETLWWVRQKRDKSAHSIPEWEQLRETASQIQKQCAFQPG
jgi:L-lactate dehydrogenase complex protein LldF